ncbi:aminotransferase class I/II-fold pyridoxal phosphate-dependent enzyme [Streptomyces oceani]|uniref:Aminotransferase class I/classII large domain-containing protein n=1 Tax=Streptomyces oceani TaxID=1075402 RepID=A0A1E7KPD4_9ACTN|nr:aminotransferase class I/II-fold pyridoxal phosphate-dependent enzyme [Streptomyces oceani]OEV05746.1 hypothetical protein AN216_01985 [Streptomyces oceani]
MHTAASPHGLSNLTRYEILALDGEINVSDGHPRNSLTAGQSAIVDRMPSLFRAAGKEAFADLEARAQRAFLSSVGQHKAPVEEGRVLSCYASSVAMDVVARSLAQRGNRIGLIHPTFDNIPDLLRGWGHQLVPLEEDALADGAVPHIDDLDALFLTVPNNPTGVTISHEALRSIAEACVQQGKILVLDTCFRGYISGERQDTYELLDAVGVEWVMIEDTGKLWPLSELKLGFISYSANCSLDLHEHLSDVLLSVSPFVLSLVAEFAHDATHGGYQQLHRLVKHNREILYESLSSTRAALPDGPSDVGVTLVGLPNHLSSRGVWRELQAGGLHVLPCEDFFWADGRRGERFIRVALVRDTDVIEKASAYLRDYFTSTGCR